MLASVRSICCFSSFSLPLLSRRRSAAAAAAIATGLAGQHARRTPHCGDLGAAPPSLCYWRLDDDCQWSPADAAEFRATDDAAMPTVVFIHGNRTDADEAVDEGVVRLRGHPGGDCWAAVPLRDLVVAGRARLPPHRADARLKADYSDVESYYLAQWLDQLRPGVKVSLIGHSFGPRIITGALHLLAGGEVAGRSLPPSTVAAWTGGKRNPVRAVLLASAIDADWLAPGGCHGLALSLVEQMLVTCNGCDRVLRWYPRLYGRGGPQAMGFVGPCGIDGAENVEVVDVSRHGRQDPRLAALLFGGEHLRPLGALHVSG